MSNFFENILKIKNPICEEINEQKVLTKIFNTNNGKLELIHGNRAFLSTAKYTIEPKVGDFYFFPHYLMHLVYPFSGTDEERRSISFNATVDQKVFNVFGG